MPSTNLLTTSASVILDATKDGASRPASGYDSHHTHFEEAEYGAIGLVIVALISIGIFLFGLGIFIKYILESRETIRRLSISSQYSHSRQTNGEAKAGTLPAVPSGVMLLIPEDQESP